MIIDEINSGWGLISHLTVIISDKFNFQSTKFEIIPKGNYSKIISRDGKNVFDL
jgi:hypothetical protein